MQPVDVLSKLISRFIHSLNSLCGISSNATGRPSRSNHRADRDIPLSIPFVGFLRMQPVRVKLTARGREPDTLNSLCGISSNATWGRIDLPRSGEYTVSQFPLWDFFECNINFTIDDITADTSTLSIPFVGFLRMQLSVAMIPRGGSLRKLSIPFVGFLRMQLLSRKGIPSKSYSMASLNSLCGISSNATDSFGRPIQLAVVTDSQFPLWDFFECNPSLIRLSFRELGG